MQKRCVKFMKEMCSLAWAAVLSYLHGKMKMEIINGKDVLIKVDKYASHHSDMMLKPGELY